MKIISIRLVNFFNYDDRTFNFANKERIIIVGANESGKSSILEGIYFSLFGQSRVKLSNIVNKNSNKTGCKCILVFKLMNNIYEINREYNNGKQSLEIKINNIAIIRPTLTERQNFINNLLKSNDNLFLYTNYLRQGDMHYFSSLQLGQQKNILLSIFNFEKINKCYKYIKHKMKDVENKKNYYEMKRNEISNNINDEENIDIKKIKIEKKKYKILLNEIQKKLNKFDKNIINDKIKCNTKKNELLNKIKYLIEEKYEKENELKRLNDNVEGFKLKCKYIKLGNCPFLDDTLNTILKLKDEIKCITIKIEQKNIENSKLKNYNIQEIVNEYDFVMNKHNEILLKYKELQNICINNESKSNELKQKSIDTINKLSKINKKYNLYNDLANIFSKNGFILYLIFNYVKYLNIYISSLIKDFKVSYKIKFDIIDNSLDTFKLQIINHNNKQFEYDNLSGGAKTKVDLIIRFAFMGLMNDLNGNNINILLIDEIAELDKNNINFVMDFLNHYQKRNDRQIFLITHLQEIKDYFESNEIIEL